MLASIQLTNHGATVSTRSAKMLSKRWVRSLAASCLRFNCSVIRSVTTIPGLREPTIIAVPLVSSTKELVKYLTPYLVVP